ncbi:NAD(P)H-binding protein [Palleronia sp. LCG004]|uniref:NAD(P)H-binding protein n=1 Tax=Palleronia sp. LCG004 TaxID=3079304 RepID=UPI002943ADD0|nr:NAD(P)H-binding protein [Palleronia sp. LCG004]WOI55700.1 NAD(P)H-binding protein [Palleronia sp. LCG004]
MSKIFVIGATGGVGSRLLPMLEGHEVHALHRKPEQAKALQRQGVTPHEGDLMQMGVGDFAAAIRGMDVVILSAGASGSGRDRTEAIDGHAPKKLVTAMEREGVGRLILVSAFMDAGRDKDLGDGFEFYMTQKRAADVAVAASGLDWVILRPGTLTDGDDRDAISAGAAIPYGDTSRGHVAAAIAALVERPKIRREIVELTDGDVPVARALDAFVRS